jgi:1-aminocyclopropane-1-carboxylate deaminase
MAIIDERNVTIQPLRKTWYKGKVAAIDMLRLDALHPVVSGNKWYKLRLNLARAADLHLKTVVTFGGSWSNHLVATAYAARHFGLASVGLVRGNGTVTPSLQQCRDYGMEIIFISHDDFKNRHLPGYTEELVKHFDDLYIIPEGGANERGRIGAGLINRFVAGKYTHVALAVGTGTTMAGLRNSLPGTQYMIGFVPMPRTEEQATYITDHTTGKDGTWHLETDKSFGGFGKWNDTLLQFMNDFYAENAIPLDVVYTGKMMYCLQEMLNDQYFNSADRVLCIHSGGLQGNASVQAHLVYGK